MGQELGTGVNGKQIFQHEVPVMGAGIAFQDGGSEAIIIWKTSGGGGWLVLIEPGLVGGPETFLCAHVVDLSRYELPQSYEEVLGEAGGAGVVGGRGVIGRPFFEKSGFSSFSEGVVGVSHKWSGWIFRPTGWCVEDAEEAGEPLIEGEGDVG